MFTGRRSGHLHARAGTGTCVSHFHMFHEKPERNEPLDGRLNRRAEQARGRDERGKPGTMCRPASAAAATAAAAAKQPWTLPAPPPLPLPLTLSLMPRNVFLPLLSSFPHLCSSFFALSSPSPSPFQLLPYVSLSNQSGHCRQKSSGAAQSQLFALSLSLSSPPTHFPRCPASQWFSAS